LGVVVLAATVCWQAEASLEDAEAAFAIVDDRAAPLRQIVQHNQKATEKLQVADQRQLLVDCLKAADRPLQLVGLISSTANTNDGSIQIQSFQLTQGEEPTNGASVPTAENDTPRRMKLGLQGYAIDDLALSRFVSQLRATGVFESVELQTSSNVQLAAGNARQYVVECQY